MLNYALIMFARIQALKLVPLLISNFQISGFAILCVMLPAHAAALQPTELPPFDSFSYLHDSVFGPERVRNKRAHGGAPSTMQLEADVVSPTSSPELIRPDPSAKMRLDELRELETRLAIDKALSQILKLTVDYGALRHRLASMAQPVEEADGEADKNWYAAEDSSTQAGRAIEQLQQLNQLSQKQINDKDKVLALTRAELDEVQARLDDVQIRLLAAQKRYEQENADRLLAEENLTLARSVLRKNRANLQKRNTKVQKLAKQLKQSKALVQELKIALGDEKLKLDQQSESVAEAGIAGDAAVDTTTAVVEPVAEAVVADTEVVEATSEVVEATSEVVEATSEVVEATSEVVEATSEVVEPAVETIVADAEVVDAGKEAAEPVMPPMLVDNESTDLASMPAVAEWLIEGLEFEEGSAEIRQPSAASLEMLITYLKQRHTLHIQVNGYTDSIGSAEYNLQLSQARAQAVADYLQTAGIAGHQIKVLGYGERRPIADNELESGRVKNRRVTIMFLE